MTDRRLHPAFAGVAHASLRGRIDGHRFVAGTPRRVAVPVADLRTLPAGPRDRQLLLGDPMTVILDGDGWSFVRSDKDGHCGHILTGALGPDRAPTHWVAVAGSHLYAEPDLKRPEIAALSLLARVEVIGTAGRFAETAAGGFVPAAHLRPIGDWLDDPAAVAAMLVGTPYLWGGNSRAGIDCSGLCQAALLACGVACPSDSDLQETAFGPPVAREGIRRGDLLFWKGHVAMALDAGRMVHATAHAMAVVVEPIDDAVARIAAQGDGALSSVRRPGRG